MGCRWTSYGVRMRCIWIWYGMHTGVICDAYGLRMGCIWGADAAQAAATKCCQLALAALARRVSFSWLRRQLSKAPSVAPHGPLLVIGCSKLAELCTGKLCRCAHNESLASAAADVSICLALAVALKASLLTCPRRLITSRARIPALCHTASHL